MSGHKHSERVSESQRVRKKKKRERENMGNTGEIEEVEEMLSRNIPSFTATTETTMPPLSLNHVSFVCKSVNKSVKFYEQVLGFVLIKRPSSFKFEGAWLFNHGIGIHLLESNKLISEKKGKINPKDNHISFECSDMDLVIRKLEEMKIEYVTAVVEEGGITVDQLFFHDPDGYMVEICNCQNLPVLPLSSCSLKLPNSNANRAKSTSSSSSSSSSIFGKRTSEKPCSGEVAAMMMENLVVDMMDISM